MRNLFIILFSIIAITVYSQKEVTDYNYVEGYSEYKAKNYLNTNATDPIEGIWQSSDGFRYAIEKDIEFGYRSKSKYRMIILENNSGHPFWKPTYIKAIIEKTAMPTGFSINYYVAFGNEQLYLYSVIGVLELGGAMFSFNWGRNTIREVTLIKIYPSK